MTTFKDIEIEYLKIEPLDNFKLDKFYLKHIDFFAHVDKDNKEQFEKTLKMLIDITCSYSFSNRHYETITIIDKIKPLLSHNNVSDIGDSVNQLYFCGGQSYLSLKYYRHSLKYFNAYRPTNQEKHSIEKLKQLCKDHLFNRALKIIGLSGLTILIVKYSIKYVFTDFYSSTIDMLGWVGAVTLLAYGLLTMSTGKKNTA